MCVCVCVCVCVLVCVCVCVCLGVSGKVGSMWADTNAVELRPLPPNNLPTRQATPLFPELLQRALALVRECPCNYQRGCPACVQHLNCKNYNAVLSKKGAVVILKAAIEQEHQYALARGRV